MKTMAFSLIGILSLAVACSDDRSIPSTPAPDAGAPDASAPVEACPPPRAGPSRHATDIRANEVWSADTGPHYVDEDISVTEDSTLTIEPCATVLVAKGKHLDVAYPGNRSGHLVAVGTAERRIRFAAQTADHWASIHVRAPGTARLAHVTLESGGGSGDFEDGATLDAIGDGKLPADPVFLLDHVTVKGSIGTGVSMKLGATFLPGSRDLVVTSSGNDANPFPVEIEEHAMDALPSGNYAGNRIDEILLRTYGYGPVNGGLTVDATLHDRGVPYRMGETVVDDFIVGPSDGGAPATLTIEAGVVLRFEKQTALMVQAQTDAGPARGGLRALGTAEKPIVFTSASANPKPGDWRGLWFGGNAMPTNALDHVRIEYAGHDCGCVLNTCSQSATESEGAVILTGQAAAPFITNSVFKAIAGHGITQGYDGTFVNFRPTNVFEDVAGCVQTLPRQPDTQCTTQPACDGLGS